MAKPSNTVTNCLIVLNCALSVACLVGLYELIQVVYEAGAAIEQIPSPLNVLDILLGIGR